MRSHDPETGCALMIIVACVVVLVFDLAIGWLVDWRLPILIHVVAAIIVIGALTIDNLLHPPPDA